MPKSNSIVMLGGGGHAKVLIELIRAHGTYEPCGILDPGLKPGSSVLGVPVLGDDSMLVDLKAEGVPNACISIGSTGDNSLRAALYNHLKSIGFNVPALVHPKAIVSPSASIGEGTQVMAGAIIQADAVIAGNAIINTSAVVEHDCRIGLGVHVASGAVMCGGCSAGDAAFIGAGAVLRQSTRIGASAVIAAGAVVVCDIPEGMKVKGVPAR